MVSNMVSSMSSEAAYLTSTLLLVCWTRAKGIHIQHCPGHGGSGI